MVQYSYTYSIWDAQKRRTALTTQQTRKARRTSVVPVRYQYLIAGTSTTCKHRTYRTRYRLQHPPSFVLYMRTTRRSLLEVTTYRTANEDGANQIDNTAFLHRLCCSLCIYSNPCTTASSCKLSITMCKFIMKVWSAFFSRTSVTALP